MGQRRMRLNLDLISKDRDTICTADSYICRHRCTIRGDILIFNCLINIFRVSCHNRLCPEAGSAPGNACNPTSPLFMAFSIITRRATHQVFREIYFLNTISLQLLQFFFFFFFIFLTRLKIWEVTA